MLSTMDTSGGVTAEEATTISKFSGSVDLSSVDNARLWTVVQAGGDEDNKLIFNAADWTGVYDSTPYSDLDIDEARDVTSHLVASDNIAKIQAAPPNPGDYLMPSNAFLVIAKSDDGDGDWREEWMGENSDGGTAVTTSELQTAIHHWLDDIPVRDHVLSTEDLQEVIVVWLSE
jgi:hypothetical protein